MSIIKTSIYLYFGRYIFGDDDSIVKDFRSAFPLRVVGFLISGTTVFCFNEKLFQVAWDHHINSLFLNLVLIMHDLKFLFYDFLSNFSQILRHHTKNFSFSLFTASYLSVIFPLNSFSLSSDSL